MNDKEKKTPASLEGRIIAGLALFLIFAGGVTGILMTVVGLVIYQIIKRNIRQQKDGASGERPAFPDPGRASHGLEAHPRTRRSAPLSGRARMRREKALEARQKVAAATAPQNSPDTDNDRRRRREELEDLLHAGIIEADEYRDRLQDL